MQIQENTNTAQKTFISYQKSGCSVQSLKTTEKLEKRRKAKLEVKKEQICDSDLENMVLASRNTEPGLISDLKDWKIRGLTSDLHPRFWAPASALFPLYPTDETSRPEKRLTEIFGGTPGSGLALAQGEAALSAQEAPHPCPACGGARSSQPPFYLLPGGRRSGRASADTLVLLLTWNRLL